MKNTEDLVEKKGLEMLKKIISLILITVSVTVVAAGSVSAAQARTVSPTWLKVGIDGDEKYYTPYNIDGNNYFKLRDIAYALSGSSKQFDVVWNEETSSIHLIENQAYTPVGGENITENIFFQKVEHIAVPTESKLYLNGEPLELTSYNIQGNNYFKLRDLGEALNFSVEWNERMQKIEINTVFDYVSPDAADSYTFIRNAGINVTNKMEVNNWGSVSPLQQFAYKNEGMAYAYLQDEMLHIVTPGRHLTLESKYPLLGDVISDSKGNFYVVWGKSNETNKTDTQTIFISKYTADGKHTKTTGFVGKSRMGDDGNTKEPFSAGSCDSAIHDGVLMVTYARSMYNGHQSNNVVGVNTKDMSPVKFGDVWDVPYTSHSFNQRIIWSEHAQDFLYIDHGDAYDRGFMITLQNKVKRLFHFYLEANADYNMWIVNKTFAQMGELTETGEGVVFVGASAKSIGEAAKEEKQNLFMQIFDPTKKVSSAMFTG
ncbi:MAG: hypothetical protein J6N32_08265, partial [Clostridia bacterium]|nr:hypothetical protein [Clostridia bacterium]